MLTDHKCYGKPLRILRSGIQLCLDHKVSVKTIFPDLLRQDHALRFHRTQMHILNADLLFHLKIYFAIDTAVGHIVDHVSERRDILTFPAVRFYNQDIVFPVAQLFCQFHRKCRIAAVMLRHLHSVQIHVCTVCHRHKGQKDPLSFPFFFRFDHTPVTAHHLIDRIIKVMERCFFHGMRNAHRHTFAPVIFLVQFFRKCLGKLPVIIQPNLFLHLYRLLARVSDYLHPATAADAQYTARTCTKHRIHLRFIGIDQIIRHPRLHRPGKPSAMNSCGTASLQHHTRQL